jgi:hypothetical protein
MEAEKLVQFPLTASECEMAASNWRMSMTAIYERRTGPRKFAPPANLAPATVWNPLLKDRQQPGACDHFIRTKPNSVPLPANEPDIAYAAVSQLSRWIASRQLTSERLTNIYLERHRPLRSQTALRQRVDRAPPEPPLTCRRHNSQARR